MKHHTATRLLQETPLSVLADVLPIAGDIVEVGTGIIAFLISAISTLVVIAIAWLFYRPMLSLSLLLVVGALGYMLLKKRKKARALSLARKQEQAAAAAAGAAAETPAPEEPSDEPTPGKN